MKHESKPKEALILWWMPVVALTGPLLLAAWQGSTAESNALEKAGIAFVWPGVLLYLGVLAVLWGGWKIDLE